MTISKKAKTILFTCCAFLILSAGIFAAVHFTQASQKITTAEKQVITSYACWPEYHIDNATEDAAIIVYGIAGPLGETQIHEAHTSDGEIYQEYHRPVEIQVIQMIKGDMDAETITYLDPGGETEDAIYEFDGVPHVVEGQAYLFFLSRHGTFLNPATYLPVEEDGTIIPYWDMRIENEAQTRSNESLPVSIDEYIAEVQQHLE